ncbi:MRC1-like domain-containing protein [Cryomyces antarcticus]
MPSSPSTPVPSSHASTSSTPSEHDATSPLELTPRTKIRKLLEDLDGSDADDSPPIALATTSTISRPSNRPVKVTASSNSSEDDEGEVAVRRPHGRMAARLQAGTAVEEEEEEEEEEAVYTRVRRQLLAAQESPAALVNERAGSPVMDDTSTASRDDLSMLLATSPSKPPSAKAKAMRQTLSTPRARRSSPGLFVSPGAHSPASESLAVLDDESDSDLPRSPTAQSRLQELVARKREERHSKEAVEKKKQQARRKASKVATTAETDSEDEGLAGRKLTQQARPTRKASKKALEEMNRETQRMSRNMQLAHQAKTRTKVTKEDLFSIFNFRQPQKQPEEAALDIESITTARVALTVSSDVEPSPVKDTPPTSPPRLEDRTPKLRMGIEVVDVDTFGAEEEFPTLEEALSQLRNKVGKGKASAYLAESPLAFAKPERPKKVTNPRQIRIHPPSKLLHAPQEESDSDDLEIIQNRFAVFDRVPAQKASEARALLVQRALAHISSPSRTRSKNGKPSMTPSELQASLQRRAREQAKREREEKLKELRARGIIIQTEEEREKEHLEFENLLEKARKDAEDLGKKEKSAAKKDGGALIEGDGLSDSGDEEDGDWQDSDEDKAQDGEEAAVELSGSEEEESMASDEEVESEEEADTEETGHLLDTAAVEAADEDEDVPSTGKEHSDEEAEFAPVNRGKSRNIRVVVDEDDEEERVREAEDEATSRSGPVDDPAAAFGFNTTRIAPLGLAQMFAGTMADSQSQTERSNTIPDNIDPEEDSLAFLRHLPSATLPEFEATIADESQDLMVNDSQVPHSQGQSAEVSSTTQEMILEYTQAGCQSQYTATEMELPDPTQDLGFETSRSPVKVPPPPHSTIDTVMLPIVETPIVKKKGRLRRRTEMIPIPSDVDEEANSDDEDKEFDISANAFDVMRKAAAKPAEPDFDKKKSEAKGMVHEQAEESEDEYAGLGGASDDEGGNVEVDEETRAMIDEGEVDVDEREIAAFFADKERADDEKGIERLYKDLQNGGLRRKRGADFDISDSEDDGEERRRKKQREFARMRKALLEDEKVGKIAADPKKAAFLRAIEDRELDEDLDLPNEPDGVASQPIVRSQEGSEGENEVLVPGSIQESVRVKRPLDANPTAANRLPAKFRRTNHGNRRPATLDEIRESVSFLIEQPGVVPESQLSGYESDGDDEVVDENEGQRRDEDGTATHREPFQSRRPIVIDRLSLKRLATTSTILGTGVLAFHAPSTTNAPGFKIPSLLRRATINLTNVTTTSERSTTSKEEVAVRRGGSKKSSINYAAREAERRAVIDAAEMKKAEDTKRVARLRRSALGALGRGGSFE